MADGGRNDAEPALQVLRRKTRGPEQGPTFARREAIALDHHDIDIRGAL